MSEPTEEKSIADELRERGWLCLKETTQPDPHVNVAMSGHRVYIAAARLSDGLVLRTRTARELIARIDAVNEAARVGTVRPWWVAEGLGWDNERREIVWPEPKKGVAHG